MRRSAGSPEKQGVCRQCASATSGTCAWCSILTCVNCIQACPSCGNTHLCHLCAVPEVHRCAAIIATGHIREAELKKQLDLNAAMIAATQKEATTLA
eukprot:1257679-Prorocentrum_lima.AAC.1